MFLFDPKTTFPHHLEILASYLRREFPQASLSMLDDRTLLVGDASKYAHMPIRWEHSGLRECGPLVNYILGFVSGDPNDTFAIEERIVDHGWYDAVTVS